MKNVKIVIIILLLLIINYRISADIEGWSCYGSTSISWIITKDETHSGFLSGKISDPISGTYKILYQTVPIDPSKTYSAEAWAKNINYNSGDFVKLCLCFNNNDSLAGNSFPNAQETNTTILNSWVFLNLENLPANGTNYYAKVGLYVHYPSAGSYTAYWDDVKLYAVDNPCINLLQNGDFESGWNYTAPPGSTERYQVYAFPRAFTPRGYDKFCSINIKINKNGSYVIVELLSLNGIVKKVFYSGTLNSLNKSILWDGRDDTGIILPMGIYVLKMKVIEYEDNIPKEKEFRSTIVIGNNLR